MNDEWWIDDDDDDDDDDDEEDDYDEDDDDDGGDGDGDGDGDSNGDLTCDDTTTLCARVWIQRGCMWALVRNNIRMMMLLPKQQCYQPF